MERGHKRRRSAIVAYGVTPGDDEDDDDNDASEGGCDHGDGAGEDAAREAWQLPLTTLVHDHLNAFYDETRSSEVARWRDTRNPAAFVSNVEELAFAWHSAEDLFQALQTELGLRITSAGRDTATEAFLAACVQTVAVHDLVCAPMRNFHRETAEELEASGVRCFLTRGVGILNEELDVKQEEWMRQAAAKVAAVLMNDGATRDAEEDTEDDNGEEDEEEEDDADDDDGDDDDDDGDNDDDDDDDDDGEDEEDEDDPDEVARDAAELAEMGAVGSP